MNKRALKRLLTVSAVSFSCLWLSTEVLNKVWVQIRTEIEISAYIQRLKDKDPTFRYYATYALERIGKEAVPALIAAAAFALGNIGKEANAAVPALIVALLDNDQQVRYYATQALRSIEKK